MLSHVIGTDAVPLLETTIGTALDAAAARWPVSVALIAVEQGVELSWEALHARVEHFAAGLLARGLKPGERIGIWSLNRVEWLLTQLAAAKAGLILVTINPAYRVSELEFALRKVGCAALVIAPPFKSSDYPAMVERLVPEAATAAPGAWASPQLPELRLLVQMGEATLRGAHAFAAIEDEGRRAGTQRLREAEAGLRPGDAVNIQFTSGTTGRPKGVTLSHVNILNNGYFVGAALRLAPHDRICIPVPLYHCFGMVMGNLASLTHGAAMVYPGEGFDPLATLTAIAETRCTALYGVPTMFIAALDHPRFASLDLSSLRTGIMAGAPCPIEVMRRVIERMHMRDVTIAYGMTETSPVSFQSADSDEIELRVSTVGRIHPHLEAKIIDPAGNIVARDEVGEICVRGYSVMLGYWDDAQATATAKDANGWMHSGDLGTLDAQGFCKITGRMTDMVIRGGENVYPREVEEFLYTHPAIRDVQVFGVADDKFGEELCAWIIPREEGSVDAAAIEAFCRDQISHFKVPRHIRFVDAFPMTVTGKVQKFVMRQQMETELAGGPQRD